ncbi:MAG: FAD-binding protein [Bdellovibrionales bacterium]
MKQISKVSINKKLTIIFLTLLVSGLGTLAISSKKTEQIASYNFDTVQKNAQVFYPENIQQVQNLVKNAYHSETPIRFSGASHSTSSIILGPGVYLKSQRLNKIGEIKLDRVHGPTVEVESGVKLGDLSKYLSEKGYSLGFAYPFYYGVTIGGLLSTGSHGTSRKHTALSSQNILELQFVNGFGELITAGNENPRLLKAARVSLGLLGFIYKIKLKIYPDFNLQFFSEVKQGQQALLASPNRVNWGTAADTEYFYWFPAFDRAVRVFGNITQSKLDQGA